LPVAVYDKEEGGYTWVRAKAGTVFLDASLLAPRNIGRLRFTEAHELAHWLIHREIYEGSGNTAAMLKNNPASSSGEDVLIERQADQLACFLLMPGGQVKMAFNHARNSVDPIAEVAGTFGVSRQAMSIRLTELHLI
jgi:Zn-dependent peptidase ImmA (M78 family)